MISKDFNNIAGYFKKHKTNLILSIWSNVMLSLFTVISIPVVIPFFQLLFDKMPQEKSTGLEGKLNGYFMELIQSFGKDQALVIVCIAIVIIFLFKNLFRYLALFFLAPVRNGVVMELRQNLYQKFLHLPLSFFTEEKKGDLIARATLDVQEVEWNILNVIESLFKSPIVILGCILLMFYISPQLTLFVFVLLIFTVLIIGGISRSLRSTSHLAQERLGELSSVLEETLGGVRIIKAFSAENHQEEKFTNINLDYKKTLDSILRRRDLAAPLSEFLGIGVVAVLLWYGTKLVFNQALTPETFFAFVFAFYQIIEPAKNLSSAMYNLQKGRASLDRINAILDYPEDQSNQTTGVDIHSFNKSIEFNDVNFAYQDDKYVLQNISFTVEKGEKVALVGPSGSGKSTMMDLLTKLQPCTSGRIFIDGVDVKEINTKSLRSLFGIVTQEAILFNESIANNIAFGNDVINKDQAIYASKISNSYDFINQTEHGFETNTGDRGSKLSGGQRQRITIARAIYKNPPILILDEATSSLDSESEKMVQEAIDKIMKDRTTFIIAHRLSTIKEADTILLIEKGKLIAKGSHHSLMTESDLYRKLVENQSFDL